jgi:hypothetical protein
LYTNTESKAVVIVKAVHEKLAEGVQYATPAVVDELVAVTGFAFVIVTPPAVYPVPEVFVTSPVAE